MVNTTETWSKIVKAWMNAAVRVGGATFLLASILIGLFAYLPDQREILGFTTIVLTAAAAITSAFYVGQGLRQGVESAKVDRTITYGARWNDPQFFYAKRAAREIIMPVVLSPTTNTLQAIQAEINKEPNREMNLVDALNFLEEMAVFINMGVLDEKILRDFYQTIVLRYFSTLQPWIEDQRNHRGQRLYQGLESLYNKWKQG